MNKFFTKLLVAATVLATGPVLAQTATVKVPSCLQVREGTKVYIPCTGVVPVDTVSGNALSWADLFGSISSSGSGAAVPTGPAGTPNANVQTVQGIAGGTPLVVQNTAPLPAGTNAIGSITNSSFGISGTLPGFASTPTVNIGTMPSVAVSTGAFGAKLQDSTGAAFGTSGNPVYVTGGGGSSTPTGTAGSPNASVISVQGVSGGTPQPVTNTGTFSVQNTAAIPAGSNAIGSITNSAFGISGTLPAFAATPTFNLGTLNGASTSALQSSMLSSIGSATDAAATTTDTTSTSLVAQTKQLVNRVNALITNLGTPSQAGVPVSNVVPATATDRGVVVGTSAVTLMAANATRKGMSLQNQSSTASCYINGITTATADYHSLLIGPGGYFEPDHHIGAGAISIICSAASTSVYAREW